jgi:biotin carboxylase
MSGPLRVWVNRSYATAVHSLRQLKDNPDGAPVHLLASHVDPDSPILTAADEVVPELVGTGSRYVEQAVRRCRDEQIDVFWPCWQTGPIADAVVEFEAIGTKVLIAPAAGIAICEDKALTYLVAAAAGIPVPPHVVVRTGAELRAAYTELAAAEPLCIKPTVATGATGFRIIRAGCLEPADLLGDVLPVATLDDLARALDASDPPPMLLMPFLGGPEYSVDLLIDPDRTAAAMVRRKVDDQRRADLIDAPEIAKLAVVVAECVGVSMLVNVQFRADDDGQLWLLEVNARASGGLHQAAAAGWNLPWAAVRLVLGDAVSLPPPRLPVSLVHVPTPIVLNAGGS